MAPRRRPAAARAARAEAKVKPRRPSRSAKAKAKAPPRSTTPRRRKVEVGGETPSGWSPVQGFEFKVGQQVHLRGTYRGESTEIVGEVEGLVDDREGQWVKLKLSGTPRVPLKEWRKDHPEEFYVNRKPLLKPLDPGVEGLFCALDVKEIDPLLEWKSNLTDLMRDGDGLPGLVDVARDLGYGVSPGGVDLVPPPCEGREVAEPPEKAKKLRGKQRVKLMLKQSLWSWKGSSLDPSFRRPRGGLKRKREDSSSSGGSGVSKSQESDQEDLFSEEGQIHHIARKCPGLLARHAIKEAKKRLTTGVGEESRNSSPGPVFVKYYRQIFSNSGASTPMKREYLTLALCLDSMLEGNILKGLDIAVQRLKSVEQISQGVPPLLANRLELIPPDGSALASIEESRTAAQEQRREDKVLSSWNPKGKGKWGVPWSQNFREDQTSTKGDKGAKGGKGKDPKGKGKWNHPKGAVVQASEVVPVRV